MNFRNRTAKKGYGMEQVMEDIEGGNPGKTAFFSRSKQEYIYCVYEPVGINEWMIMLGQPENIVLGDAENIRFILRHFIIFETTVFLLYLLFLICIEPGPVPFPFHEKSSLFPKTQTEDKVKIQLFQI